jgi:hypothetical protein
MNVCPIEWGGMFASMNVGFDECLPNCIFISFCVYDNNYSLIIDIYFYETFSILTQNLPSTI